MRLRVVPPVLSPLGLRDLAAGMQGGDRRQALEQRLRERHGSTAVLLVDSGTSALTLALASASSRRPGAACLLPAYGCYDLVTAAVGAGVRVRLYDIDPMTLGPRWSSLEEALRTPTAAVVVVHLFGVPVDVARVRHLADHSSALLIEDAAQAAGTEIEGSAAGSHGDLGILSFGRGKGVTGGGGGALLVNTEAGGLGTWPTIAGNPRRAAAVLAPLAAQWMLARPLLYALPAQISALGLGHTVYRPPQPTTAAHAVSVRVASRTLEGSDREAAIRRRHAHLLAAILRALGVTAPTSEVTSALPGLLRFPLLLPEGRTAAEDAAQHLGILPSYPQPLSALEALRPLRADAQPTPGADDLAARLLTLPTHSAMSARDLHRIERWLVQTLG